MPTLARFAAILSIAFVGCGEKPHANVSSPPRPIVDPLVASYKREAMPVVDELRSYANLLSSFAAKNHLERKSQAIQELISKLPDAPTVLKDVHLELQRICLELDMKAMIEDLRNRSGEKTSTIEKDIVPLKERIDKVRLRLLTDLPDDYTPHSK
ncbi:MAG: hypothetical protein ACJ8C4_00505 [Gemmataceae bacterium]